MLNVKVIGASIQIVQWRWGGRGGGESELHPGSGDPAPYLNYLNKTVNL